MLGAQIGQYRILDVVGGGGMGIVFRARQEMVDRDVALKLLPPELAHDEINSKRLEREAKALAKLNHPNIVTTFDFGLTPSAQAYLVMELVDGESLKELLLREGRIELSRAIKIFVQMADAMRFAHKSGIIHRDLKPHNVMIAQVPSPDFVKILDFGIARLADSQKLTRVGEIIGSPLYMSPEQCLSEPVDERTDIYALGVLMYVCLTGHVPFKGDTLYETVERKCTMPPPRFQDIAPELQIPSFLEELVRHCLAVEKEDRIQAMDEVKSLLESIASSVKKQKQSASAESTTLLNGPVAVPDRPAPPPKTIREKMQESSASRSQSETRSVPPKLPRSATRGPVSRPARSRPATQQSNGIVVTPGILAFIVISILACMAVGAYLGVKFMVEGGTVFAGTTTKNDTVSGTASHSDSRTNHSSAPSETVLKPSHQSAEGKTVETTTVTQKSGSSATASTPVESTSAVHPDTAVTSPTTPPALQPTPKGNPVVIKTVKTTRPKDKIKTAVRKPAARNPQAHHKVETTETYTGVPVNHGLDDAGHWRNYTKRSSF